jgi:Thiolase C-terminal domain-like
MSKPDSSPLQRYLRQVKGCEVALAHGNGGVLSSQSTVILGAESTV